LKGSTPVYLLGSKGGNPDSQNYLIHGSFNTEQNCTGAFHVLSPLPEISSLSGNMPIPRKASRIGPTIIEAYDAAKRKGPAPGLIIAAGLY